MVLDPLKIDTPWSTGHMQDIALGIPSALCSGGDSSALRCVLLRATLATLMTQDKTTGGADKQPFVPVLHTANCAYALIITSRINKNKISFFFIIVNI